MLLCIIVFKAEGMFNIRYYMTPGGKSPIREYINSLDDKTRNKIWAYTEKLKQLGPKLKMPYSRKVSRNIYELRVQYTGMQFRFLYFYWIENDIVIVHVVEKKRQKLRMRDINLAEKRRKEIIK